MELAEIFHVSRFAAEHASLMGGQVGDLSVYLHNLSHQRLSPLGSDNTLFHK